MPSSYVAGDGVLAEAKYRRDRRARTAAPLVGPGWRRTVVITVRTVISRSCREVTRAPGLRGGVSGPGRETGCRIFINAGEGI